jgi:hypothetical protein
MQAATVHTEVITERSSDIERNNSMRAFVITVVLAALSGPAVCAANDAAGLGSYVLIGTGGLSCPVAGFALGGGPPQWLTRDRPRMEF